QAILAERLSRPQALSDHQLLSVARIQARSGHMPQAAETYQLLAMRMLGVQRAALMTPGAARFQGLMTALAMTEELNAFLDPQRRMAVLQSLLRLLEPDIADRQAILYRYERFAMLAWSRTADGEPALEQARRIIRNPDASWPTENLIALANL